MRQAQGDSGQAVGGGVAWTRDEGLLGGRVGQGYAPVRPGGCAVTSSSRRVAQGVCEDTGGLGFGGSQDRLGNGFVSDALVSSMPAHCGSAATWGKRWAGWVLPGDDGAYGFAAVRGVGDGGGGAGGCDVDAHRVHQVHLGLGIANVRSCLSSACAPAYGGQPGEGRPCAAPWRCSRPIASSSNARKSMLAGVDIGWWCGYGFSRNAERPQGPAEMNCRAAVPAVAVRRTVR